MARIVIIGAGLTGLSAAYHLEKHGFYEYVLLEKETSIGGLCGSVEQDGFTFDYTGHLLHINDSYFRQFIEKVVGFDFFNAIDRRSFIFSHNRYTHYPYQINLRGLPEQVIADCIQGFVQRVSNSNPDTFREWVLAQFGTGFAEHFFVPYQEKIFSCSVDDITASWTSRFVPPTTLADIIRGIVQEPVQKAGYNAHFLYPKCGGIVSWVRKIAEALIRPIQYDSIVQKIDMKNRIVMLVNGHAEPFDQLITTMPLDLLLRSMKEKSSMDCVRYADKLRCNSIYNFNFGINIPNVSDKHWIYFPESRYPFYRIGFPHNLSKAMAPEGCSSLYGEVSFMPNNPPDYTALLKKIRSCVYDLFLLSESSVVTEKNMLISHAYVIFDQWREQHLSLLLSRLSHEGVHSVGRYGAWKYASMQEAVLDGKQVANVVLRLEKKEVTDLQMLYRDACHIAQKSVYEKEHE